jgi:D-galactarolactone cycloisomerase
MSKISRIELFHVAIPLAAPFYPSWIPGLPQTENRFDLIKITTEDGITGYSAGPAMYHERRGLGDLIGPYLIGEDATDIALIQQRLREISYLGWRQYWIEPAFWDILGKSKNKPVYELLGGEAGRINLYASTGELKTPNEIINDAEAHYEAGFRTIKIRVHDMAETDDINRLTTIAKAIGGKMKIGVDANQGWRVTIIGDAPLWDLPRAKRFADVCADHNIAWLEEPLPMDDYESLANLRSYSQVPIAGGELHSSGQVEFDTMLGKGCYDIYQPDAIFTGGIFQTFEIAKKCREKGVSYTPHTWTNGIGFAVNLQLMAASGFSSTMELEYPISPPGWTVESRDAILETPFTHDNGTMQLSTLPGLGFKINRKILKKYGKRFFNMDNKRLIWFSIRTCGVKISKEIDRIKRKKDN